LLLAPNGQAASLLIVRHTGVDSYPHAARVPCQRFGQLNRWVVDEVLVAIGMYQRRSLALHGPIAIPTAVRSVRVQHPDPEVAEVAVHVAIGKRSAAIAFRLEAMGDRWLCTVLELGTRWSRP